MSNNDSLFDSLRPVKTPTQRYSLLPWSLWWSAKDNRKSCLWRHHRYPLFLIFSFYCQPTYYSVRFVAKLRIRQIMTNGNSSEPSTMKESGGIKRPYHPHDIWSLKDADMSRSLRWALSSHPLHFIEDYTVYNEVKLATLRHLGLVCFMSISKDA